MTTLTIDQRVDELATRQGLMARIGWALRDGWTVTWRELAHLRHQPGELAGALIFPGIMVVMFGYVFGSAITVPGGNYREYLMPGLFAMTALMGVMVSALLVSKDIAEGVMDRFRSMPMARSAIAFGRAGSDLLQAAVGMVIMAGIGLLVGWRAHNGILATLGGFGLIVLMRYAVSWIGIVVGMSVKPETADAFVPLVFPVSMISNSFVPTSGMPGWLRFVSDWNPISALVQACRELFGNPGLGTAHAAWPIQHAIPVTIGWSLLLLAVFVPLATWKFRRAER